MSTANSWGFLLGKNMDTGTDSRRFNFFIVDNEAVDNYDLNPYEGWLYVVILRHINQQTGIAFPSLSTLAKKAGMTVPTVIKYLKSLEEKRLIVRKQQRDPDTKEHKSTHYTAIPLVKEVNKGCKPPLVPLVKEVNTNNTKLKNTNEKEKDVAPTAQAAPSPSDQPPTQQAMFGAICVALGIDPDTVTRSRASTIGKTATEIRQAKGKPEHMNDFMRWLKAKADREDWTNDVTENAMRKYWPDYASAEKPGEPEEIIDFGWGTTQAEQMARIEAERNDPDFIRRVNEILEAEGRETVPVPGEPPATTTD
jgi:hypothetical protein